jgi:hypothetical protein
MKDELAIRLFSRRSLTESVTREQITALSDFAGGLMRPDRCSEFEPIRTPFDPADISEPVRWLAKPHGEFFYQKGRSVYLSGEMWNLTRPPTARFPSPLFRNYWTGQFDGRWATKIGLDNVEEFLLEMFLLTASDFGLLTTEVDLKAKNTAPPVISYKGLDPATGVPGLYWINLFSDEYAKWLGLRQLSRDLAVLDELPGGGVRLKFCDPPNDCRTLEVLQKQRAAIDWLGPQRFFDNRSPDRKQEVPDWTNLPLPTMESIVRTQILKQ